MTLAKPTNANKKKVEQNSSLIQFHLKGIAEGLKELDPSISESKFRKGSYGNIFNVNTTSKKVFYFEEDNREVTFSYEFQKKTNKQLGINIYCTFRLEARYVYKEFDDIGKSIAEKYIDNFNQYKPRFIEFIKEGEKLFEAIDDPESKEKYIFIYANFDAKTAILRVGDNRITFGL